LSIFCSKYLQIIISLLAFDPQKHIGATLKRIPNGFKIPNPELLNPDFATGFKIYNYRWIGIVIPLGTNAYPASLMQSERARWPTSRHYCKQIKARQQAHIIVLSASEGLNRNRGYINLRMQAGRRRNVVTHGTRIW
jgi:hypothetical protein